MAKNSVNSFSLSNDFLDSEFDKVVGIGTDINTRVVRDSGFINYVGGEYSTFDVHDRDENRSMSFSNNVLKAGDDLSDFIVLNNNRVKDKLNSFIVIQKWIGTIVSVGKGDFIAKLEDVTAGGTTEEVTLPIDNVEEDDISLLSVGAIFYWSIGYEVSRSGRRKSSIIKFRRQPKLTQNQLNRIQQRVEVIKQKLNW